MRIDINADLGEGFGRYTLRRRRRAARHRDLGQRRLRLPCRRPRDHGAHLSRWRRRTAWRSARIAGSRTSGASAAGPIPFSAGEIERLVAYQIGAAQALASYAGHRITHVNAHGTLANLAETDKDVADAVARAIFAVDRNLAALAIARSEQVRAAERAGLRVFSQIYADRAYTEQGTLVPRAQPGAVIHDAGQAAARVVAMVEAGALITGHAARS